MKTIRLIGDVHGKMEEYLDILQGSDHSIQVGDFGAGFVPLPTIAQLNGDHRFIRGNHDNPQVCHVWPTWIQDGTFLKEWNMFLCGGALSIDQKLRMEGVSWWRDEELSIAELYSVMDKFLLCQPKIMITHDCPESVCQNLENSYKRDMPSKTRDCLQAMFEAWQPTLWVFGHWHQSFAKNINGTMFVCLDELEFRDLEIEEG